MKKLLVILLSLLLVLPAFGEDTLDTGFEDGTLSVVPCALPQVDPKDVTLPEGLWEALGIEAPADVDAYLEEALKENALYPLSFTADGKSGILSFMETLIACYNGHYAPVYPSPDKGVQDTNGNLARFIATGAGMVMGSEGAVFSPDGRYAVILNASAVMQFNRMNYDPIVIDLQSGEAVLTTTYANGPIGDPATGCALTACFSRDGDTLYYTVFSRRAVHLYAYSLSKGKTQRLCTYNGFASYPRLVETASGNLLLLKDATRINESTGFVEFCHIGQHWQAILRPSYLITRYFTPTSLQYSQSADLALVLGHCASSGVSIFQLIDINHQRLGFTDYYGILQEDQQLKALSLRDMTEIMRYRSGENPYMAIISAAFSPDGRYLLMLTYSRQRPQLALIRLSDLTCRSIALPEEMKLVNLTRASLEWNDETILLRGLSKSVLFNLK